MSDRVCSRVLVVSSSRVLGIVWSSSGIKGRV